MTTSEFQKQYFYEYIEITLFSFTQKQLTRRGILYPLFYKKYEGIITFLGALYHLHRHIYKTHIAAL